MELEVKFSVDSIQHICLQDYEDDEFSIGKMNFLSTRPNSHGLVISEKVLKEYSPTVLGKWVVADMTNIIDAGTHTANQKIVGRIPENQEVQFVEDDDGYLKAYVDVVLSKIYAKDYCSIFENENQRAVSVEMKIETKNGNAVDDEITSLKIVGVTTLGKQINPSVPGSSISLIRFSENEAEDYYNKTHLTTLEKFAQERKTSMNEKTYKIDKTKESVSDTPWGEVDKAKLREKVVEAKNSKTLVKSVYLLVEKGWEEAPSEHLKYPVMELKDNIFVYNRDALSTALAYAKKENETSVVNKIEKIYKQLGFKDGKEEETKMAEIEFSAVDIGNMWSALYNQLESKYPDTEYGSKYVIRGIYEEDDQKFAIIQTKNESKQYRLDFNLTEAGFAFADDLIEVEIEFVPTNNIRKFADTSDIEEKEETKSEAQHDEDDENDSKEKDEVEEVDEDEQESNNEDLDEETSLENMRQTIQKMQQDIEERDNIIMSKEAELQELRNFKEQFMKAEQASKVEAVMQSVSSYMDKNVAEEYRNKGMSCEFAQIDAWANEVKASIVDKVTKKLSADNEYTRMSGVSYNKNNKSGSVWDRL